MIVEQIIKDGATLIDVRDEIELIADGNLEQATHIPMDELEERTDEILEMPTPVVIFCRGGGRAQRAVDYLSSKGMTEVHNGGGFEDVKKVISE